MNKLYNKNRINNLIAKAIALDRCRTIEFPSTPNLYLINQSDKNNILVIPDDVTRIPRNNEIKNMQGHLKVVGGHNLTSTADLFSTCSASSFDLSELDTSNVEDMHSMFNGCKAKELDLSSFDTRKVTNMAGMFHGCSFDKLNISSFNTSNVKDISYMFSSFGLKTKVLDLSHFDTSNVRYMEGTFSWCAVQKLNLSSFDTSKVISIGDVFSKYYGKVLSTDSNIIFAICSSRCQ